MVLPPQEPMSHRLPAVLAVTARLPLMVLLQIALALALSGSLAPRLSKVDRLPVTVELSSRRPPPANTCTFPFTVTSTMSHQEPGRMFTLPLIVVALNTSLAHVVVPEVGLLRSVCKGR